MVPHPNYHVNLVLLPIAIVFCHETMPTRYNSINWLHIQITFSILYTLQLPLSFVMKSCLQTIIASIGSNPNYHLNLVYLPIAIIFCHETMPTNYLHQLAPHPNYHLNLVYLPIAIVFCDETMPTNYNSINWLHTQITISILYTFQLSLSFVMRPCSQTTIPWIGSYKCPIHDECVSS